MNCINTYEYLLNDRSAFNLYKNDTQIKIWFNPMIQYNLIDPFLVQN